MVNKKSLSAAVLSALLSTAATAGFAADAPKAETNGCAGQAGKDQEKCYGVVKAGRNDCASKDGSNGCAGLSKKDADPNQWVFVPAGLCDKLTGGAKG